MELNYFKDMLFDAINDSDKMKVSDIEADDSKNVFIVTTVDGSVIKVKCEMVSGKGACIERYKGNNQHLKIVRKSDERQVF